MHSRLKLKSSWSVPSARSSLKISNLALTARMGCARIATQAKKTKTTLLARSAWMILNPLLLLLLCKFWFPPIARFWLSSPTWRRRFLTSTEPRPHRQSQNPSLRLQSNHLALLGRKNLKKNLLSKTMKSHTLQWMDLRLPFDRIHRSRPTSQQRNPLLVRQIVAKSYRKTSDNIF